MQELEQQAEGLFIQSVKVSLLGMQVAQEPVVPDRVTQYKLGQQLDELGVLNVQLPEVLTQLL